MALRTVLTALLLAITEISSHPGAFADTQPPIGRPDTLHKLALRGIRLSLDDRFRAAESVFTLLTELDPVSPIGPLFAAGNIQAEMLDTESREREPEFEHLVESAEERARALISTGVRGAEVEFALGVARGYRAVQESKWGGWFAALRHGLRAKGHFRNALATDSAYCDAYLGLGSYLYWKSAKTDWINWLPIVADERGAGIAMLIRTVRCGVYARDAARAALASVFINEGDYAAAIAQADTLAVLYPMSKGPLWLKAKAYYAMYEWDLAARAYDSIEARIRRTGTGNYYNLIECAYYRAHCYWGAGRYQEALGECGKALTYPADKETRKRQGKRLDELRRLQRKLVRMLNP